MTLMFRIIREEDSVNVLKFLRKYYYSEEPLTIGCEPLQPDPEEEKYDMSSIKYGMSLMAFEKSADNSTEIIAGVLLAGPKYPSDLEDARRQLRELISEKRKKILKLIVILEEKVNIFHRYNVKKVAHVHACGIHSDYRGKSIAFQLLSKSFLIAKNNGFQIGSLDSTNTYSARIAEKLNMQCICTIPYSEYVDESGVQIFSPPSEHTAVRTYAKKL